MQSEPFNVEVLHEGFLPSRIVYAGDYREAEGHEAVLVGHRRLVINGYCRHLFLLISLGILTRECEWLLVHSREALFNDVFAVAINVLGHFEFQVGTRQGKVRPTRVDQVDIVLTLNKRVPLEDRPRVEVASFAAVEDITSEQAVSDVLSAPNGPVLTLSVLV